MISKIEIRAAIKFCFKLKKTAKETLELIQTAYGEEGMSRKNVMKWFNFFKEGREDIQDDARTGRPKEARTPENIQIVADLLKGDRCLSTRLIGDMVGLSKDTVHSILVEDLGKKKVCARFVPHMLTEDQKDARVEHCKDMKETADSDPNFLKNIVTGDESWCFRYEPTTKRQSAAWKGSNSPTPKKSRLQKSRVKTLITVFFDSKGVIHKEFTPQGQTVNKEYYLEVLKRLLKRIARVRPEYKDPSSWSLLHDNAPAHKALVVKAFLAQKGVTVLDHPPYSPDLAPCDFWLFPKLKMKMKGQFFDDIPDIQEAVTDALEIIPKNDFLRCFESFYKRFQRCIDDQGDYFE